MEPIVTKAEAALDLVEGAITELEGELHHCLRQELLDRMVRARGRLETLRGMFLEDGSCVATVSVAESFTLGAKLEPHDPTSWTE